MAGITDKSVAGEAVCGLYVHIPFCDTKCGYCDFFSVPVGDRDTASLVGRLCRELETRVSNAPSTVGTVFCGGGTPTVLPIDQLRSLLDAIGRAVPTDRLAEFTVEANPATVDDEKARLLVDAGVNRISVGAQSFVQEELTALERRHTPDDIAPSIETLRRQGVGQVNLDLIFGIPGQTLDGWSQSLNRAIDLEVDHIAAYGLTYEPGTRLTAQRQRGLVACCDEHLEAEMYLLAMDTLAEAGFEQYEISNYARPGCQCRHNLIYWRNGPYIGVGPSAAGCVERRRYKNISNVREYIRMIDELGHAEAESESLDTAMVMTEMIMMQLRLVEGLNLAQFHRETGTDALDMFGETATHLTERGLINVSDTHLALTRKGRLKADAVIADLAPACSD